MPRSRQAGHESAAAKSQTQSPSHVTLKDLAESLNLSSATVSMVINSAPAARSIPAKTQERVWAAARKLNYKPNFMAKSLRQKRSYTIGVIVPEISEGYEALVLSGVEDFLLQAGFFYYVVSHRHRRELIGEYVKLLQRRGVEGLIAVDTAVPENKLMHVVSVSGHHDVPGVTNIILDHDLAAKLAVEHLADLGHKHIAFIKGQAFSSDTAVRAKAWVQAARKAGIRVSEALTAQLVGENPSPELGYVATRKLLDAGQPFTALVTFNDISAIGAIKALSEAGLCVPRDVSVVGFDDVQSAAYQNPALTTVKQPLRDMGALAAKTLMQRISLDFNAPYPKSIVVKPELVVRASTAPPRKLD
jgi:LacI family transcriptional regulator